VLCNQELREIEDRTEEREAPEEYSRIWVCDVCGRRYWRGSHYERTLRFLESLRDTSGERN